MTESIKDESKEILEVRELWKNTFFICADGDNLAGIEFLDDGKGQKPEWARTLD